MPAFLKYALVAVLTAVSIVGIAFVTGAFLPGEFEVTRTVTINRPPQNVWWVLTDYNNLQLWHPQYRGVRMLSNPGETPVRWSAIYTDGLLANVVVTESKYPVRYAERINDNKVSFTGGWEVDLQGGDLTTQVTAHSHVELHKPFDKLFVRLFIKPGDEVDRILQGLKRRVEGSTVKPSAATS
jgi:uncharacterized protein YndB with AHSA1/START domain